MIPILVKKAKRNEEAEKEARVWQLPEDTTEVWRRFVNEVSIAAATLIFVAGALIAALLEENRILTGLIIIGSAVLAALALFGIKIARQWEKAVVLGFGRFRGLRGLGCS